MRLFQKLNFFDRIMAAVSFAEADEYETARGILDTEKRRGKRRSTRKTPEKRADDRPRIQM